MAVAFKIINQWEDTKVVNVLGTLVFSGSYVTGGDTINFGLPSTDTFPKSVKSNSTPMWLEAQGANYLFVGLPGTQFSPPPTAKIQVFSGFGIELAAGAYPAGLTGATPFYFQAVFPKHQ